MSRLTALYLWDNNLSGSLPSSNYSLHPVHPRIKFLSLSQNQLSGSIPSSLSHCHHLRLLSLSNSQFSGNIPPEMGNLHELRAVFLGGNHLSGAIPSSLGNLTNLRELELNFNSIHGVIPEEFGGLSNLRRLIADGNEAITGPIPASLSNISTLVVIDLTSNQISGAVNVQFGNMPRLKTLFLSGNNLTGGLDFLSGFSNCRNLTRLEFGGNELEGPLPDMIGNLSTQLMLFVAAENRIRGKIPGGFSNLTSLIKIDMGYNELVGTIPTEIVMLESLQVLILENNKLSGSILSELGQLQGLSELYLEGNNLSGSIPDSLGNISTLQHLALSSNALSSGIPESLWSLTGLIELSLSHNFLDGPLSPGVGGIKSLDTFDVSVNRLSGNVPDALKELQMLKYLDLSNNSFDGQISKVLGEFMINLQVLNLSCNNLSGTIPDSLANLRHIKSLNLSFNKLQGKIPNSGAFLDPHTVSLEGNAQLCGDSRLGFPPCSTSNRIPKLWTNVRLLKYILPSIVSFLILAICCYFLLKALRKETKNDVTLAKMPATDTYRLISYRELVLATKNFCEANLLGRGSFGSLYKGCLDDGLVVAIKVLNFDVYGASRSFDIECHALSMARHRNLVKIISTCSNLDFRAIVLEFFPNGSLERWLSSEDHRLSLLQRINISLDVALALECLHHHHPQVIVHCDLKPGNVLLDEDMMAHVGDFGIAKLLLGDTWTVTSAGTRGTLGYIAPEYASMGRVSRKGDVYSFGILLLEIFMGKSPTDPMFVGGLSLRKWVCEGFSAPLLDTIDRDSLEDGFGSRRVSNEDLICIHECLSRIVELGIICSSDMAKERPLMTEVVPILQKIKMDCLSKLPDI